MHHWNIGTTIVLMSRNLGYMTILITSIHTHRVKTSHGNIRFPFDFRYVFVNVISVSVCFYDKGNTMSMMSCGQSIEERIVLRLYVLCYHTYILLHIVPNSITFLKATCFCGFYSLLWFPILFYPLIKFKNFLAYIWE